MELSLEEAKVQLEPLLKDKTSVSVVEGLLVSLLTLLLTLSPLPSPPHPLFSSFLQVGSQATQAWQDITTVVSHFRAFGAKEPVRKTS